MPATAAPPPMKANNRDAERLLARLNAVRRRFRFFTSARGLCWVLTFFVATVLLEVWLDWRLHSPNLFRALALVGILSGGGLLVYRGFIRPLARRMDNLTLALQIEDRYPSL